MLQNIVASLDLQNVANVLIVPAVAWTLGFIRENVTRFLENRNAKKALRVYKLLQKAVEYVYTAGGVEAAKATGEKLTKAAATQAMSTAIVKAKEYAKQEGAEQLLPTNSTDLKLMIEQVISDRKSGVLSVDF